MKLTVLFILLAVTCFAQKFQPKIAVEFFYPEYHIQFQNPMNNTVYGVDMGDIRTKLGGEFTYKKASVYFDQHLYMDYAGAQFDPVQAYWFVGATYTYKSIKFKYEHECIHPINTYSNQWRTRFYGGYDMISISYGY